MNWPTGLKKTPSRLAVLAQFTSATRALSALDLHHALPNINVATLYRIVDSFVEHGILERSDEFQPKEKHYQLAGSTHRHTIHCVLCDQRQPLSYCPVHLRPEIDGFQVLNHRLEIEGICMNCRQGPKININRSKV
jgi:Fur family transcriptional regulator, zinc uptake regulator